MIMFSSSKKLKRYKTKKVTSKHPLELPVTARQEQIKGFEQKQMENLRVLLVGAGGINGEVGEGLVRKGAGQIIILDDDIVELSNLNRQLFFRKDLSKPKAFRLAKNLAQHGVTSGEIIGYNMTFQEAVKQGLQFYSPEDLTDGDISAVVVCGVDNDATRVAVARYYYQTGVPVVFLGTSLDANQGYIFVQETKQACFSCAFPNSAEHDHDPVHCAPSSKDILKSIAGFALSAIDSLVMKKMVRHWNFRKVVLNGIDNDLMFWVRRNTDCILCKNRGFDEQS